MAGRRTNLALLVLLAAALATGLAAYSIGTSSGRWIVLTHALGGLAMVTLIPWKSVIVRRGLRRPRPGRPGSIALMALILIALISGFLRSAGLVLHYGPLNAMQVHVGAALLAIPLALSHLWRHPVLPRRTDLSRRALLRTGSLAAVAGVLYIGKEGLGSLLSLAGSERRFTGSFERGSGDPAAMPTTQWFNDTAPSFDPATWSLRVRGPEGGRTIGYEELLVHDDQLEAVLDCTSGWWSRQQWSGIRLDRLFPDVEGSIVAVSATGYRRRFPAADAGSMLLATRLGGEPLSVGHGAPVRIVAPGRRGFWWVKWVDEIALENRPWWLQTPFPLT